MKVGIPLRGLVPKIALSLSFLTAALLTITSGARAQGASGANPPEQRQAPPAPMTVHKVRGNLYALQGKGGHAAFYVTGEGVVLVDSKNNGDDIANEILTLIRTVTDQPVRYVINTHYHPDHIGNNGWFQQRGATIISTTNAREHVLGRQFYVTRIFDLDGNFVRDEPWNKGIAEGKWKPVAAPIVFTDEITITLGGKVIRVRYFGPAHTNGDAFVFFPEEKALAAGDNLRDFCGVCVDYHAGGSLLGYISVLDGLLGLPGGKHIEHLDDFDLVLPGHGQLVTDRAGLLEHRNKLVALRDQVIELKRAGKTYREIAQVMIEKYQWKPEDRNLGQLTFPGLMAELHVLSLPSSSPVR